LVGRTAAPRETPFYERSIEIKVSVDEAVACD